MRYIKYFRLFESKHYEETYWEKNIDGERVRITIQDIQDYLKNAPVIKVRVKDIEDMCVHKNKTDKGTLKRSQDSDLSFPIIISKDEKGEYNMILDGHHRLKKAVDNGIDDIEAKILDLGTSPVTYQSMFGSWGK